MGTTTPPPSAEQNAAVGQALEAQDPVRLAGALDADQLQKLELAEKVLELQHNRRKRASPLGSIVSLVAFGGLAVNAFQSWSAGKTQERIRDADQKRWTKEFDRAREADRYNAFLATSALATDSANADKRLVGYALLQEFVDDKAYNGKTTLMLEQALFGELDRDNVEGLSEEHANSVSAILSALSGTSDCGALTRAVRSIGRISKRRARTGDVLEAQAVFEMYVRRLYGRAAEVCKTREDFAAVERPLRETLEKAPEIGALPPKAKVSPADAGKRLAEILLEVCKAEMTTGVSECPDVLRSYDGLCQGGRAAGDATAECALIHDVVTLLPPPAPKGASVVSTDEPKGVQ